MIVGFLTGTSVSGADFSAIMEAITNQISVSTVVSVLAVAAGSCIGLVFMWWGVRKCIGVLMSAFRKGKVSL